MHVLRTTLNLFFACSSLPRTALESTVAHCSTGADASHETDGTTRGQPEAVNVARSQQPRFPATENLEQDPETMMEPEARPDGPQWDLEMTDDLWSFDKVKAD